MPLELGFEQIADPHGHADALRLQGDWVFVLVSDGYHVGIGEASHSGDDAACRRKVGQMFRRYVQASDLTLDGIRRLEAGPFSRAPDHLSATVISGLNQALYDLLARRLGVPVWRLFIDRPLQTWVPAYVTINRALRSRTVHDYYAVVERVEEMGFRSIKCAPFDGVAPEGEDQLRAAREGLSTLTALRSRFPRLSIRVDCHNRFKYRAFKELLPLIEAVEPYWIEEPCPLGVWYEDVREQASMPIAAGELSFGVEPFRQLVTRGWSDVVMPDVKHVGGVGAMVDVCRAVDPLGVEVSPHNPSGPVSTLASAQIAAISRAVTSIELSLLGAQAVGKLFHTLVGDQLRVLEAPGWGIQYEDLRALT